MEFDILIQNGTVIDGTGEKACRRSIGVKDGKIVFPQEGDTARKVIDAQGKIVSPGFIDAHSHGDLVMGEDFARLCKTSQGVTTEMCGQCGLSMAPINPKTMELIQGMLKIGAEKFPDDMINWTTYKRYLDYAHQCPKTTNIKSLVGHSTLRVCVMGFENRESTEAELEKMKDLLREAMEQGAAGLSTGLIYTPSCYATTHEIVELAKVVKPYGGFYASHMRNESHDILSAIDEVLEIGRKAEIPVVISHFKVMGKQNWHLQQKAIVKIQKAIEEGISVTCDQYPYTWNQTALNICIPPWHFDKGVAAMAQMLTDPAMRQKVRQEMEDTSCRYDNFYHNAGGWEGVVVTSSPNTPGCVGKSIAQYAKETGKDPWDTYFDILVENDGDSSAIFNSMTDENLFAVIRNPNVVVGSDGLIRSGEDRTHPRAYGTCPRAINYFVKENHILTLEEMIRKMTSLPAQRLGFASKGVIREGYDADLVVFDYEKLEDTATYLSPIGLTKGIDFVIVNGQLVWQDGNFTGNFPGKIIPHNR